MPCSRVCVYVCAPHVGHRGVVVAWRRFIDFEEFRRSLRRDAKITAALLSDVEVEDLFRAADATLDGRLDIDEFVWFVDGGAGPEDVERVAAAAALRRRARYGEQGPASPMSSLGLPTPGADATPNPSFA